MSERHPNEVQDDRFANQGDAVERADRASSTLVCSAVLGVGGLTVGGTTPLIMLVAALLPLFWLFMIVQSFVAIVALVTFTISANVTRGERLAAALFACVGPAATLMLILRAGSIAG